MPAKVEPQKTILDFAMDELKKTISSVQKGKIPNVQKLQEIYQILSEAELKRQKNEISDKEMEDIITEQVSKIRKV